MSSQIEITENGISVPQTSEVKTAFQDVFVNALGNELSLDDATPQGDIINELTLIKQQSNTNDLFLFNQFNPETAQGIYQDAIASLFGLKRKPAQSSIVTCQCTGVVGTVLPAGTMVQSTANDYFESIDTATIDSSGTVNVQFQSVEKGEIPCPANSVNKIFSAVSGLESVNNATEGTLGYQEESRADFEERRKKELARNATGSLSSVYSRLYEVENVQDVFVWENITNSSVTYRGITLTPHSIYVCVNGGQADEIAEAIYSSKSAGCDTTEEVGVSLTCTYREPITQVDYTFNYFRPSEQPVYMKVGLGFDISDDGKQKIKEVIEKDWDGKLMNSSITIGSSVYASRFYKDIDSLSLTDLQLVYVKVSKDGTNWYDVLTYDMNELPTIDIESESPAYITFEVV